MIIRCPEEKKNAHGGRSLLCSSLSESRECSRAYKCLWPPILTGYRNRQRRRERKKEQRTSSEGRTQGVKLGGYYERKKKNMKKENKCKYRHEGSTPRRPPLSPPCLMPFVGRAILILCLCRFFLRWK